MITAARRIVLAITGKCSEQKGVFLCGSYDRYSASERLVSFRFSMTGVCSAPLKLWTDY
jgi:hypothetical protein